MDNIILIGFMGAGKTTIGKALEKELSMELIDIDSFIEETSGKSIPELFKIGGEDWFRNQESEALKAILEGNNRIVATGGGIVEREENFEIMKNGGKVFYLKSTVDKLWTRAGKDPNRPLSKDLTSFRKLFEKRKSLYEKAADVIVETDGKSIEKIVEIIKNS